MLFKVTMRDSEQMVVGAENNKHLEISIFHSDDFQIPKVEGRAYIFEEKEFKEFWSWEIGDLKVGDKLVIEALDSGEVSEPTKIEFSESYRQKFTIGTKARIKDEIEKTKRFQERLNERRDNPNSTLSCSFCEKIEGEVKVIIPYINEAICNECIDECNKEIKERGI
jgi:hypothetical protein